MPLGRKRVPRYKRLATEEMQAALYYAREARLRRLLGSSTLTAVLFSSDQPGILFDPRQIDTMIQKSNDVGIAPVTAHDDPVGIAMDIRLWGGKSFNVIRAEQSEELTNGDFSVGDLSGWVDESIGTGSIAYVDGKAVITGNGVSDYGAIAQTVTCAIGDLIIWEIEYGESSVGVQTFTQITPGVSVNHTENGTTEVAYIAVTTSAKLIVRTATNTGTLELIRASAKIIPGNHLSVAADAERPLYKSAEGRVWIEGDGVDDFLRAHISGLLQPWDRVSAIRHNTFAAERYYDGASVISGVLYQNPTTPSLNIYSGAGSTAMIMTEAALGEDHVIYERHAGASSLTSINGGADRTDNAGTVEVDGVTLFANTFDGDNTDSRSYGFLMRSALSERERTIAEAWATLRKTIAPAFSLSGQIYPGNKPGIMLDPSQIDTLYANYNAAVDPVTADSDPVGLAMDIRTWRGQTFAQVLGNAKEMVSNGDFAASGHTEGWVAGFDGVLTVDGDEMVIENTASFGKATTTIAVEAGDMIHFSFDLVRGVGTPDCVINFTDSKPEVILSGSLSADGSYEYFAKIPADTGGTVDILFVANTTTAGETIRISNVSAKVIPGNHAIQDVAGARPLYRVSSNYKWLDFDGVDDFLTSLFTITQPFTRHSGIRYETYAFGDVLFSGPVTEFAGYLYASGTPTPEMSIYAGTILAGTDFVENVDQHVMELYDGATSEVAYDGNTAVVGNAGTDEPGGIDIGRNVSGAVFTEMRLYSLIMVEDELTAGQDAAAAAHVVERINQP